MPSEPHYAQYGNTILKRGYCYKCRRYALIVDDEYQCCGRAVMHRIAFKSRVMSEAQGKRRKPNGGVQKQILAAQDNKCAYCGQEFGSVVVRGNDAWIVSVCWDHYVPYAFSQNNHAGNFVAACQVCNGIKSSKVFETMEDARAFIKARRDEKGYGVDWEV